MSAKATNRPLTVIAVMLAVFLSAIEVTVVSTAMPTIVGELGGVELYAWVFTAYILVSTVGIPIFGKLSDLYGRKPVLIGGIALFLAASTLCGFARTMLGLIVFRALQGLGAGAMQSTSITIIGDIFTLHERSRMQGVVGAVWGLAGLMGPLVGGVIVKSIGWPWVFFINLPFGLASAALLMFALHEKVQRREAPLDWPGALALGFGLVALLAGARARGLGKLTLLLALASFVLFLWIESRAKEPVLPPSLFRNRVLAVASACGALIGGSLIATNTFVPLYVQGVLGGSPTQAGAAIAPMAIAWPLSSAIGGRLLPRVGFRPLVRFGLIVHALAAIGLALLLDRTAKMSVPRIGTAVFGMGLGFANTALLIAVQNAVEWRQRGVATASTMLFRSIGGALAVGMLGELLARAVAADPAVAADASKLLAGGEGGAARLGVEHARQLAQILAGGLHTVFWAIAGFAVIALLIGLWFPRLAVEKEIKPEPPAPAPEGPAGP